MTKQLTSKELGIPPGYRLSQPNVSNIVMVATRQLFAEDMIKHVRKESDIFIEIMNELYPDDLLQELLDVARKLTRETTCTGNFGTKYGSRLILVINSAEYAIGCKNYYYSHDGIDKGIANSEIFKGIIKNLKPDRLKDLSIDPTNEESNIKQLSNLWFNKKIPFSDSLTVSKENVFLAISPGLRKKVKRFLISREILSTRVLDKRLLLNSIANAYTSAAKLCNDAPEFINYVNDSDIYNKDGKKCTDMSTADMIQQLRKS